MWYVTNDVNKLKLKKFESKIIVPFWKELIYYKRTDLRLSGFEKHMRNVSNLEDANNEKLFELIGKRRHKKRSFFQQMDDLASGYSLEELRHFYAVYILQNRQLQQHKRNIWYEDIPEELKIIFCEYFYNKFFDDEKIWLYIDGEKYTRAIFHFNFKEENSISVCPYCDIDTTNNIGNNNIEHFFPKSRFPFLAMNALNLISSCPSCNMPFEGKGTKIYFPITRPVIEQIGEKISFSLAKDNNAIIIESTKDEVENYIKLLQLDKRYANIQVYNFVKQRGEALYASLLQYEEMCNVKISSEDIIDYIKKAKEIDQRQIPLYFATIDIFKDFDNYSNFKNKL